MNNHTPGPWRVGASGFVIAGDKERGVITIATVHQQGENHEWIPNGYLIASAPEMLVELKNIELCVTLIKPLKDKILAVIAKAEGRTNRE